MLNTSVKLLYKQLTGVLVSLKCSLGFAHLLLVLAHALGWARYSGLSPLGFIKI